MLSRLLAFAVIAVSARWAWTGPIHDWRTVTMEEQLQANAKEMAHCLYGKEYAAGATGSAVSDPEAQCARELNLYRHEGKWYSYSMARPAGADGSS